MKNGGKGIGCGTIIVIILVILFLLGSGGNKSSSSYSNPIRDRDPEFYDQLERRYNNMIENERNKGN